MAAIFRLSMSVVMATALIMSGTGDAAKILVVPSGHHSHVNFYTLHAAALVEDGHEVWEVVSKRFESIVLRKPEVHPLIFPVSKAGDFHGLAEELMEKSPSGDGVAAELFSVGDRIFTRYCEEMMENKELMLTIEEKKFDLAIVDAVTGMTCLYLLPYRFGIPHITVFGFQLTPWGAGVTGMPSVEPELDDAFTSRMTFWQRLKNLQRWMNHFRDVHSELNSERLMRKYIPSHRPRIGFDDVMRQSEIFLLNFETMCLDYPRTSAPNFQFLGGGSVTPAKALPDDLEEFVQGAEHGVVIMTLGSLKAWQSVWFHLKDKVFEAFGRLDQRVIVHYTLPDTSNIPSNVRIMKWLPQNDLLGHPKTRLFITHGGNNGANEAVYHGVPMVVIPVTADQPYSGVRVEFHGYGKFVRDKVAITADELHDMMREVIENKTYTENIKKCSEITRSMPTAQEKFVFWVNHILRFGGAHLRPASIDMPLYQVLMLDIVAFFLGIGLAVVLCCLTCCCLVYRRLTGTKKVKKA